MTGSEDEVLAAVAKTIASYRDWHNEPRIIEYVVPAWLLPHMMTSANASTRDELDAACSVFFGPCKIKTYDDS